MATEEKTADAEKKVKAKAKAAPAKKPAAAKKAEKAAPAKKPAAAKKTAAAKVDKAPTKKASAKAEKPKVEKKPAAERDAFGFRKGSKKSEAAKMYSTKKGATLAEVKEKTGSSQLNLLKELEEKGWAVSKTKETGKGKKQVTRYKIEGDAPKGKTKK